VVLSGFSFMRWPTISPTSGEARQDRCQERRARAHRHVPDGRGCGGEEIVSGNSAADRWTATKTGGAMLRPAGQITYCPSDRRIASVVSPNGPKWGREDHPSQRTSRFSPRDGAPPFLGAYRLGCSALGNGRMHHPSEKCQVYRTAWADSSSMVVHIGFLSNRISSPTGSTRTEYGNGI